MASVREGCRCGSTLAYASDPMRKPDVIKLVRAFDRINDPKARKKMLEAVRSAADALAPER